MSGTRQRQLSALDRRDRHRLCHGAARRRPIPELPHRRLWPQCPDAPYSSACQRPNLTLSDLADQPLILRSRPTWLTFHEYLDRIFKAADVPLKIAQSIEESVAIFGLVVAGGGVTLYPDCQRHLSLNDVAAIPISGLSERIETIAIWASPPLPQAARVFLDFVLEGRHPA
ncbi:MAG: LysR substrate-binding domain-containing protein [Hyphomicrobiaceae bacterium]